MKKNNVYKIILLILVMSVYFVSVGFSAMSVTGRMENIMASVKPTALARITNVLTADSLNSGMSNSEDYNKNNIFGNINLPFADSTVTYKVNVTVFLESIMKITDITNLNPNLEYELTNYNLGSALCNRSNKCNFDATSEIYVTLKYKDGCYDSSNTEYSFNMNFVFEELVSVAQIGSNIYESLQDAIDDVPNNTQTTIVLLKNTSESVTIPAGKNIVLDLQNYALSNSGANNVIKNNGTLEIHNGIITSNAAYGAVDNYETGIFKMSGGSIYMTGDRQAIYNRGGFVEISGTAHLSSTTGQRATIQNLNNGNVVILGGTIESERNCGIENTANLTIGVKDGTPVAQSPIIQGNIYGVKSTTNFNYYDGTIRGYEGVFNDESKVADVEQDYGLLYYIETVNLKNYKTCRLARVFTVEFNANDGEVSEGIRNVERNSAIGILPVPTRSGFTFEGWFTDPVDGVKIDKDYIVSSNTEVYAHWTDPAYAKIAKIGDEYYSTLGEAFAAVPKDNTETTIDVIQDTSEVLTVEKNQNIVLNIQNNVLSNSGVNNVIKNNGTLSIISGTITSNTTQGAINNNKGATLYMSGGSIYATGTRQAIYNDGGTLIISGDAYLSSTTNQRATVQNLNKGTVTFTGGTIVSSGFNAIENTATLIIGEQDGTIDSSNPVIIGRNFGVNNSSSFSFYDGIIKGVSKSINGNINNQENNSSRFDSTETIDGNVYNTTCLINE